MIERPNGDYSEQPDPIPEDPYTFEVECAADARWTPRPLHGGTVMPRCIRKNGVNISYSSFINFSFRKLWF